MTDSKDLTVTLTQAQLSDMLAKACKNAVEAYAASLPARTMTPGEASVAQPAEPDVLPADIELDCSRTDLPPRSPREICILLKFESRDQTLRRIKNDLDRYSMQRAGCKSPNQQSAITTGDFSANATWTRR